MARGFGTAAREGHAGRASERAFLGIGALMFVACAAGTIYWSASMSGGMPMPGGWTQSMAWVGTPEQTWPRAAASFMAMWIAMMGATAGGLVIVQALGIR